MTEPTNPRRRKALGRGLGALIPGAPSQRDLFHCPIDDISPTVDQPRSTINPHRLRELADSIVESGVLQPVLLKREGTRYRLIAGERRWRASRLAGLEKIPALVKDVEDDEVFALALIENVQREDLTPIEEALAYRRLIDEYTYTQKQLAEKVGRGRSTIANTLRLLDLPDEVKNFVASGSLSAGHARAVLSVPAPERVAFANRLIETGASVRDAEAQANQPSAPVRERFEPEPVRPRPAGPNGGSSSGVITERTANIVRLERLLREALHARAVIHDRDGRGKVEIFYDSDDTLQEILDRLLEKRR